MLAACDYIAEDERLIYDPIMSDVNMDDNKDDEQPKLTKRVVLLEDFTGQRCSNCPTATNVIEQLQKACGDALVAVAIHGGDQALFSNAKIIGLRTEMADEYYNYWKLQYKPVGLINRHSPIKPDFWATAVKEELTKPAPLRLEGTAVLAGEEVSIHLKAEGTDGTVTGKLQVWLLEDGIQTLQLMPDGTANQTYTHNHVLRTAVNGTWGEDCIIKEAETSEWTMSQALEPDWNREQLSIVAFVYDDSGVQQTVKIKVEH